MTHPLLKRTDDNVSITRPQISKCLRVEINDNKKKEEASRRTLTGVSFENNGAKPHMNFYDGIAEKRMHFSLCCRFVRNVAAASTRARTQNMF